MVRIGNDGVLLPAAQAASEVFLAPGKRVDVIIDFRNAPDTVYLRNHLEQDSGRGPDGDWDRPKLLDAPVPLLRFDVVGAPVQNDATIVVGTPLRPWREIADSEVVATRRFRFHRSNGAWKINDKFFDEMQAEATPLLGTAERWIFENGSGGWWHPVHVHLEHTRSCATTARFRAPGNGSRATSPSSAPMTWSRRRSASAPSKARSCSTAMPWSTRTCA
jgi:FtsP/CotA-like multicopper oxidase with cupredoxin domain